MRNRLTPKASAEGLEDLRRVDTFGSELGQHLVRELELADAGEQDCGVIADDGRDRR
jgi:hypothetical protein